MISASSLDRIEACPPSAVIGPRAEETGEAAEVGNVGHEFLRRVGVNRDDYNAALACVDKDLRSRFGAIDIDALFDGLTIVGTEEAYTIDILTGEITYLGSNIHRDYEVMCQRLYKRPLRATEIPTTLDVEAMRGSTPVCMDYKTGLKTAPAGDLLQMWCQAFVLAMKYDAFEVEARPVYIDDEGHADPDPHTFNRMDLDGLPERLRRIHANVEEVRNIVAAGDVPTVFPGAHCRYCPAIYGCPAKKALIKAFLPLTEEMLIEKIGAMTLPQLGEAKMQLSHLEKLVEKAKDTINAVIAQNGSVPADPGYEWRVTESAKTYYPKDLVRGRIMMLGGGESDLKAIERKSKFPVIRRVRAKADVAT